MKYWVELRVLLVLMMLTGTVFITAPIDLEVSRLFHDADSEHAFPLGKEQFWAFLYWLISPITAVILFGSLAVVIWASFKRQKLLRGYAALVLLTLLLGPGLIVNTVFKDNWQRPRPIQTAEFGGPLQYVPPLIPGDLTGPTARSFPSGHSSVAFALCAFWLVFRRRWPALGRQLLAFTIVFGATIGLARIVAGGHYLSDVLFSAYFTFFASLFVYHVVLGIPRLEDKHVAESVSLKEGFVGPWNRWHEQWSGFTDKGWKLLFERGSS